MRTPILTYTLPLTLALGFAACKADQPSAAQAEQKPPPANVAPVAVPPVEAPPEAKPVAGEPPFKGQLILAEGVKKEAVAPTDVLFIMARTVAPDGQQGQLVAVQRLEKATFPLDYEMSDKNLMMPQMPFAGPFKVQARLDKDGDPMTKGDQDLYAEFEGPVKGGQEKVDLVLTPKAK